MMTSAQWQTFIAAPHRVMFLGGALQTLAVMLWFMTELLTRYEVIGQPIIWSVAPSSAHAYLMIYGLLPWFMFGFLMTTFPRWMKGREIPKQNYVPAFVLLMLGAVGFYVGLIASQTILRIAVTSTLAGWGIVLYALMRVLVDSPKQDKIYPQVIFGSLYIGWCCQIAFLMFLVSDNLFWLRFSIEGGIWLFLLPVFATVGHKMIPFFTSSALPQHKIDNPKWAWVTILIASAGHCFSELRGAYTWLLLSDLPLAIAAIQLSRSWGFSRSLKVPMLGVLHIGFAWLGVAMVLFNIQSIVLGISNGSTFIFGLAPLHALTIGCFSTLLIGMATRVTLGHSGLPMKVDTPIKLMFAGLQLTAVLRVMADMLPTQHNYWLYVVAGAVWLGCFITWVLRYLPVYWRKRADGHAG